MTMQTIFDITAFGAIGDGETDNTAAIQAAFDAAAQVRGCVTVPPGVYKCGEVHLGAGVALRGEAAWQYGRSGASVFSLCDAGAKCLLDITGAFGCEVDGMCFDGNMLGNGIHGIRLYWDEYNGGGHEDTFTVDNCRVASFSGNGIHVEHGWCFTVRHSHLAFNRGAGLYLDGWDGFVLDNWMSGNSNAGFLGGPCSSSITFTGNRVEWNRNAGFSFCNGDSLNITGNFFDRSYGPALVLGNEEHNDLFGRTDYPNRVSDVTVTGNIFRRSGKPNTLPFEDVYDSSHLRMTCCENVVATGNVFKYGRDDGGGGVDSPEYCVVMRRCQDCIVNNNVMQHGCMKKNYIDLGENEECIYDPATNLGTPVTK